MNKKAMPLPSTGKGIARTYHYFYLIKIFNLLSINVTIITI